MKRKLVLASMALGVFLLVLGLVNGNALPASAGPGTSGYTIDWYTFDGGGAQDLTGGTYSLSGTAGQSDAGSQNGGSYQLNGGFW